MYDIDAITIRKAAEKACGEGTQVSHPIYVADDHVLVNVTPKQSRSFRGKFYFKLGSFDHKEIPVQETTMSELPDNAEILYHGKWLLLGKIGHYEFMHRHRKPKAVMIVAITTDNHLILTVQKRVPHKLPVVEIPAGLVDDGETYEDTAARELLEECGYKGNNPIITREISTTPGICTETIPFAIITDCVKVGEGGGLEEEGENITTELLNIEESPFYPMNDLGRRFPSDKFLLDMKLYAGLFVAYIHKK